MTENNTVTVELSTNVEIHNSVDFDLYARALGVEVGQRGRKPFAALIAAIDAADNLTLIETDYFGRDKATVGASEYQREAKQLRDKRDADIAGVRKAYSESLTALKTKHDVTDAPTTSKAGKVYRVTATKPQRAKDGTIKRNAKGDRVLFAPSPSTVDLTAAEIRASVPDMGERGRPSSSHALRAAVVKGDWLPADALDHKGWETLLLSNPTVQVVDVEPVTADAASE